MTLLLIGAILVPLIAIPILFGVAKRLKDNTGYIAFVLLLVPLVTILYAALQGSGSNQGTYQELYSWTPIGNFGFRVDNLGLPILFVISLLTALVSLFSVPYMRQRIGDDPGRYGLYYALYALYSLGMIGTVLATNLIEFYLFFEIMLVPSFFLIAEWGYGEKERISLTYFIWTHVGALVLLVGILVTAYLTGVTDMDLVIGNLNAN